MAVPPVGVITLMSASREKGYGKAAAALAVRLLKAAFPNEAVKLSTGQINRKAQRLYEGLGFVRSEEMDGDDLVFVHL